MKIVAKWLNALAVLLLGAYFAYFASGAIHAHFAQDDPVNIGYYWPRGFGRVILDNLTFWTTAYRPMGGLFYLSIYHFFHLNPLPYRLVILAILAANIALTWRIAEKLSESTVAGALAAALVCGHAAMETIYYDTSMIYDILAYFFLALMLAAYIRFRGRDLVLRWWQIVVVALAYVAALNSKEIAVVGAGWVLAYEVLIARPRRWTTPVLLIAIGIVYTVGKMYGPESLSKNPGYQLDLSVHRWFVNNGLYLNSLFYSQYFHDSRQLLIAWGLLTVVCALSRKRELWWCWFLVSTATLGTSFTVNPRDGGSLYVPLLAWALLVSLLVTGLMRRPVLQWAAAGVVVIFWSHQTVHWWHDAAPAYLEQQRLTWSAIQQIERLPRPKPGSRVIILNSPFRGWHALFISELVWDDHSIEIAMGDKAAAPPTEAELKSYDWVMGFDRDQVRVLRKP